MGTKQGKKLDLFGGGERPQSEKWFKPEKNKHPDRQKKKEKMRALTKGKKGVVWKQQEKKEGGKGNYIEVSLL